MLVQVRSLVTGKKEHRRLVVQGDVGTYTGLKYLPLEQSGRSTLDTLIPGGSNTRRRQEVKDPGGRPLNGSS